MQEDYEQNSSLLKTYSLKNRAKQESLDTTLLKKVLKVVQPLLQHQKHLQEVLVKVLLKVLLRELWVKKEKPLTDS